MLKIRQGVFETNSSSVHSLVIAFDKAKVLEDAFTVSGGEYGWGYQQLRSPEERTSYLWQGILDATNYDVIPGTLDEWKERINKWLPNAVLLENCAYDGDDDDYWYVCGIDHVGELFDFIEELWNDDELLGYFLTDDFSHVICSNDNDSYEFTYPDVPYIEYRKGN